MVDGRGDIERDAARWRWLVQQTDPQVHVDPFHDCYTLVISKGISVPITCKTGPGVHDIKSAEQTPPLDEAIDAAMSQYVGEKPK